MKKITIFLFISILVISFQSCYYDKSDTLYPIGVSAPCTDTTGVISYTQKIVPILQSKCYGCHPANGSSGGGIAMGTYATDKLIAQNGKLYGSMNHATGFSPMPKGAAKMSACQLALIKKWIVAGASNN